MSSRSRSSRSRQSGGSRISDDQINDLVSKLQQLLPELRSRNSDKVSAAKVLQETCNYIRNLHREVDDLSERLSELLATTDTSSAQAAIIRSLLMQNPSQLVFCQLKALPSSSMYSLYVDRSYFFHLPFFSFLII